LQTNNVEDWLVYVFDGGPEEPTADEPYAPLLSFGSTVSPVILQITPKPWEMMRGPSGTCAPTEKPLRAGATLETVLSDSSLSANIGQLIARYRFSAGRLVYIDVKPLVLEQRPLSPILIRAYAKDDRESPFSLACELEVPPALNAQWTLAIGLPGNLGVHPIWMVEVMCLSSCPTGRVPVSMEIHREAPPYAPQILTRQHGSDGFRRAQLAARTFEYFCYSDREIRSDLPLDSKDTFAGTTELRIKILGPHVSKPTIHVLESYFLAAIALWRRACLDCVPDHLSVIRLNDRLFIDKDLAEWLFSLNPKEISATDKDSMSEPGNIFFFFRSIVGRRRAGAGATDSASYVEISPTEIRWRSLCAVPGSYLPEPVSRIQRALPCTATAQNAALGVELNLVQNGLSCGKSLNIIACEQLKANVELNIKDYSFTAIRSLAAVVGKGATRVDLMQILLHEIGHWIGLGHTQSSSSIDIMNEYYESGWCIENTSVDALQGIIARHLRPQGPIPSALKYGREPTLRSIGER